MLTYYYNPVLRGFEITAIVVCVVIVAAIFMCYLTWKFRYIKIVLRTVRLKLLASFRTFRENVLFID